MDPTANPYVTTSVLEAKKDKVTVLWVEGLTVIAVRLRSKIRFMRNRVSLVIALARADDERHGGFDQGAQIVWSGLVIAENVEQPSPIPPELSQIEQTLKDLFRLQSVSGHWSIAKDTKNGRRRLAGGEQILFATCRCPGRKRRRLRAKPSNSTKKKSSCWKQRETEQGKARS